MTNILYNVPTRTKIVKAMKRGINSISRLARKLSEWKSNIYHHLQTLKERGTVIKMGKQYYLKKYLNKDEVKKNLRDQRGKILRKVKRSGNFDLENYKEFKSDFREAIKTFPELQFMDLKPIDILKVKRKTALRVMRNRYNYRNRKFEQLVEFKRLCDQFEKIFGISIPKDMKKIHHGCPELNDKFERALAN